MAGEITDLALQNAALDAATIAQFVTGPASGSASTVTNRLGASFPTIAKIVALGGGGGGGSITTFDVIFDTSGATPGSSFDIGQVPTGLLVLSRNGDLQSPGGSLDYTISGSVITTTTPVLHGEVLRAQGF